MQTRYVNPASNGGNGTTNALTGANAAYASLNAAKGGVSANPTEPWEIICETDGTADTAAVTFSGITTSAANYLDVHAEGVYRASIPWSASSYRIEVTNGHCISISTNYIRIRNLQIKSTQNGATGYSCINLGSALTAGDNSVLVDSCLLRGVMTGSTGNAQALYLGATNGIYQIRNTVVYDFTAGSGGTKRGVRLVSGTASVYNCTVHNCAIGYERGSGTFTATNCGAASCTTAFTGVITQTTCSSSSPTFVDEAGDDFHLAVGDTTWKGNGTDLSGTFTTDIDGQTRSGTWDIGADEYVAAGGGSISGSASKTLGAATISAAGALKIAGAASKTLGSATISAAGKVALKATASVSLGAVTSSASGKVAIKGQAAKTLGAATVSATGLLASGPLGSLNKTLGSATCSAAGKLAIKGQASASLSGVSLNAAGALTGGNPISGVLALVLGSATLSASGTMLVAGEVVLPMRPYLTPAFPAASRRLSPVTPSGSRFLTVKPN